MTRKDYILAASLIQLEYAEGSLEWERTVNLFSSFFLRDNPQFLPEKFKQACRISSLTIKKIPIRKLKIASHNPRSLKL
jgi:hypothetical protein